MSERAGGEFYRTFLSGQKGGLDVLGLLETGDGKEIGVRWGGWHAAAGE